MAAQSRSKLYFTIKHRLVVGLKVQLPQVSTLFPGDTNDMKPILIWACYRLGRGYAVLTAPLLAGSNDDRCTPEYGQGTESVPERQPLINCRVMFSDQSDLISSETFTFSNAVRVTKWRHLTATVVQTRCTHGLGDIFWRRNMITESDEEAAFPFET